MHASTGPLHKQIFVVPSASLEIYTVSSCTIRFQNAQLPKCGEAISVALCACSFVLHACRSRIGTCAAPGGEMRHPYTHVGGLNAA
jgi:hypothetical protein